MASGFCFKKTTPLNGTCMASGHGGSEEAEALTRKICLGGFWMKTGTCQRSRHRAGTE